MTNILTSISYASGFYSKTFEEFIIISHDIGFQGVQFIPDQSPNLYNQFSEKRVERLRAMIEELNMFVSFHNVFYDINLCSLVPDISYFSRSITEKVLMLSKSLGSKTLTVHPGYIYPGWRNDPIQYEKFWECARINMKKLCSLGVKYDVQILLENGSYCLTTRAFDKKIEFHVGIDVVDLKKLLSYSDGKMGICMDIGKLRASRVNYDFFITELSPFIREVQISNRNDISIVTNLIKYQKNTLINIVFEGKDKREMEYFLDWSKSFNNT